jgi:hypothetical protein
MEGIEMKLKQNLCINPAETITGFNPLFTKKLLKEAVKLKKEGLLFAVYSSDKTMAHPSSIGASCLNHLCNQIKNGVGEASFSSNGVVNIENILDVLSTTEKFLAIFEEK